MDKLVNDNEGNENRLDYAAMLEEELNQVILRERNYSLVMGSVIRRLPLQKGYKHLPESIRQEIEDIITAID